MRTNKEKGRIGLSLAIAYFEKNGYTINIPLNDTQWYDLVVEKNGVFKTVQCKCTETKNNLISLRSTGGTKGKEYDNVLSHNLDYLFCVDNKCNCFLIPVNDIREYGGHSSISLRLERNKNFQGFESSKYVIK